ncbi:MAG: relaxase domain-containing protein [Phycisphaerales bacterium]|nr:relaxase domain-containing protein [Phycisphaerales bacterium]
MLRIRESTNPAGVLRYFLESLTQEEFKELKVVKEPGYWVGALAERLGLAGTVSRESFAAMLTNIHPQTGDTLTPRTKEGRRCCYEFEVSTPKSLSVLYHLTNDSRLLGAFADALKELVAAVQDHAHTRVRRDGADEDRLTQEVAGAVFIHRTGRPVNGIAEPQLHAHPLFMNATWDPVEQRLKAVQFGQAWGWASVLESLYMSSLAEKVMELGYSVSTKGRFWEIDGVPESVIEKFSSRTKVINGVAAERGIDDPRDLDGLGARTRERKVPENTLGNLKAIWAARLTHDEQQQLFRLKEDAELRSNRVTETLDADRHHDSSLSLDTGAVREQPAARRINGQATHRETLRAEPGDDRTAAADGKQRRRPLNLREQHALSEAIREAAGKVYERKAVVPEKFLLDHGLRAVPGRLSLNQVREEMKAQGIITRVIDNQARCTTREAVAEEQLLVKLAVAGKGRYGRSSTSDWRAPAGMTPEQKEALGTVLSSPDLVTIVKGRAGTGKTHLTKATVQQIVDRLGRPVCMLAPTAQAGRGVLRSEGHRRADTVAKFLNSPEMQARVSNGVIWVDEAGLMSMKDTIGVLQKAAALGCRVVLSGDSTHQNRSVARGSPIDSLQEHAGVRTVNVEGVQRQKGAYKEVVERLNRRDLAGALRGLDEMNALRSVPRPELFATVAADYVACRNDGKTVSLVAPTHAEGREVTLEIRRMLREAGQLKGGTVHDTLQSKQLTEFERKDSKSYTAGDVVCFHRNLGSPTRGYFKARSVWTVIGVDPLGNVLATSGGLPQALPLKSASGFDVYRKVSLEFAVGDTVRFTNSGTLHSKLDPALKLVLPSRQEPVHKVDRGEVRIVTRIGRGGALILDNGLVVPRSFGHITHGYCLTSHAAQGVTADIALGIMSTMSGLAASFRQFYVTVTRGREAVRLYTDDRELVVSAVARKDQPDSALSLVKDGVERPEQEGLQQEGIRQQQQRMAEEAHRAEEAARERDQSRGRAL